MTELPVLYRRMLLIRRFEERVLTLFTQGKLSGTTHTYIGQEAGAVGVLSHLHPDDSVFSNHRCHGHYLVKTGDIKGLLSEMMGKRTGVCGGIGGSQHLCGQNFYSNGILGSQVPIAAGVALAEKLRGAGRVVTVCVGDGALGEGVVYETLNMASLYSLPILVLIENNRIAQTTPLRLHLAGSIVARPRAFGIDASEVDSIDVRVIDDHAGGVIDGIRTTGRPHVLVLHTNRLAPHSKGDDTRPQDEVAELSKLDPLGVIAADLPEADRTAAQRSVDEALNEAERSAMEASLPALAWAAE